MKEGNIFLILLDKMSKQFFFYPLSINVLLHKEIVQRNAHISQIFCLNLLNEINRSKVFYY